MSISYHWRPEKGSKPLNSGVSHDYEVLQRVFGPFPIRFSEIDIPKLRAMHEARSVLVGNKTLYGEIADVLENTQGAIEVSAES